MFEKDYIELSKKVYDNMNTIVDLMNEVENDSAWIRDFILTDWLESRGVKHLFHSSLRLGESFVSDKILDAFCSAGDTEQADQRLNFILLRCCEEGVDIC
jgi:hypothetical protein